MSSSLSASILRLKLLDALRSGDCSKTKSIVEELSNVKSTIDTTDIVQLRETILHYAVQVAPLSLIQYLIDNAKEFSIDINSQDTDGNTPLHLAAMSSRFEIVKYLLFLPQINDTIVNLKKKQPVEVCKDLEIAQLMQIERAKFVEKVAVELRQYFSDRDFDNLERLLVTNPRASELLDINGAEPETGNTVLHEFIRKEDLQMCEWILSHGGDPFKRDKRGKLPIDLISSKNEPLRKLLKTASKDQNIMDPVVSTSNAIKTGGAPTYKGYLRKWTNFASGYKLRYFVLDPKGILSYYTNQDDTNNACRGSLNLGFASLHLDSSEKLKFEIIGKNGIRWHLKANHPIETNRWVWTLQNAITIAKDNLKKRRGFNVENQSDDEPASTRASLEDTEPKKHRKLPIPGRRKHKRNSSQGSLISNASNGEEASVSSNAPSRSSTFKRANANSPNLAKINENKFLDPIQRSSVEEQFSIPESDLDLENFDYDNAYGDYDSDTDSMNKSSLNESVEGQLSEQLHTIKRSIDVEITSLLDLYKSASTINDNNSEVFTTGLNTLKTIQDLFVKYNNFVQSREKAITYKLERQLEVNRLWESSIRQLENKISKREQKLAEFDGKKKQIKKYLTSAGLSGTGLTSSEMKDSSTGDISNNAEYSADNEDISSNSSNEKLNETGAPESIIEILNTDSDDEFFDADEFDADENNAELLEEDGLIDSEKTEMPQVPVVTVDKPESLVSEAEKTDNEEVKADTAKIEATESQENEFSNIPKAQQPVTAVQSKVISKLYKEGSFLGYENPPRVKLAMDEDNRPKVGLWGILKSMVGKDMTRMTLPVSFNEPTSLLQRLAEDVEYSDLLNKAATFEDSTLRMVYVAAFAASEYASTIDRIAKPFNPLLGETFEYCRPDKSYRMIVEQVSHHPPISACSVESTKWDYYGENAVESQFRVNFDFKHLGKMFAVIRPDKPIIGADGKEIYEELYSWKKVNTSVVGIIIGSPKVDNYGKMEVTNHTTGDVIIVDMKQRGWKASSAYQLSGQVIDRRGRPHWAIGGHWNSKIFAKKISGVKTSELDSKTRNSLVDTSSTKVQDIPTVEGKFLVWQAAPRPKIPFNLTGFAVSLNGIDEKLKPWLAPSDTRLRPDQRAMEDGRYDEAADIKHRVEVKQRVARKDREAKNEVYKPNWFVKKKHPVTGDAFWEFKGEYWRTRKEKKLENTADIF